MKDFCSLKAATYLYFWILPLVLQLSLSMVLLIKNLIIYIGWIIIGIIILQVLVNLGIIIPMKLIETYY